MPYADTTRIAKVAAWEKQKRSEAAKRAAKTRKENARIEAEVMAEIEADEAVNGPAIPRSTQAEREKRCKALLTSITPERRPANKWLPDDIFQMTMKLRNPKVENLRGFVCRLIREELDRQTTEELRRTLTGE